jgi:hypothetical protein
MQRVAVRAIEIWTKKVRLFAPAGQGFSYGNVPFAKTQLA